MFRADCVSTKRSGERELENQGTTGMSDSAGWAETGRQRVEKTTGVGQRSTNCTWLDRYQWEQGNRVDPWVSIAVLLVVHTSLLPARG